MNTNDTHDETTAIDPDAFEEARALGEAWADRIDLEETTTMDDVHSAVSHGLHQSAHYANTVLPRLRALAGFEDVAGGTYTSSRMVRFEGIAYDADYVYEDMVEAYHEALYSRARERLD